MSQTDHMKKRLIFFSLIFCASQIAAQKINHNENRDPIFSEKASGLQIKRPSGITKSCVCCGGNALKGTTSPIVFLDGKEISVQQLSKIDSNLIKSITVLKDAEALQKFGEGGRQGVLIVETKKEEENLKLKNKNQSQNSTDLAF